MALKHITGSYSNEYFTRLLTREISIMKELTSMADNIFTTKLKDVLLINEDAYLIMDYRNGDLRQLLQSTKESRMTITEDHVIVILHNILNAI